MITTYRQTCPVIFGRGALGKLGKVVKEMNAERLFCVCDTGVEEAGMADRVRSILEKEKIKMYIYDGVLPDAPDRTVRDAGEKARIFSADLVLGIGGGSSLDTAKAVAVLCDNPAPVSQYYMSEGKPFQIKIPLILVPTTAGTGSEVTVMGVIHDSIRNMKETVIRPADLAIVDPELTVTVPPAVTAATALDAMSHALEAYTSAGHTPVSDMQALEAVRLIRENLVNACKNGNDLEARTNLAFASNIAGMAFNDASVHLGHAAAHELGIRFHMPHGVACALAMPEVIRFAADFMPGRIRKIAEALGLQSDSEGTDDEIKSYVVDCLTSLMRKTGIRSMRAQGLSLDQVKACARGAVENNGFITSAPGPVTVPVMERLLEEMYLIYQ